MQLHADVVQRLHALLLGFHHLQAGHIGRATGTRRQQLDLHAANVGRRACHRQGRQVGRHGTALLTHGQRLRAILHLQGAAQLQHTRHAGAHHRGVGCGAGQRHAALRQAHHAVVVPLFQAVLPGHVHATAVHGARHASGKVAGYAAQVQHRGHHLQQRRQLRVGLQGLHQAGVVTNAVGSRVAAAEQEVIAMLDLQMPAAAHKVGLQAQADVAVVAAKDQHRHHADDHRQQGGERTAAVAHQVACGQL